LSRLGWAELRILRAMLERATKAQQLTRRPVVVALFLAALIGLQADALATQFRHGFSPLRAAPERVAFSWDMFSIPIERCGISWEPALAIGAGYKTLREFAPRLEWDPLYNEVGDYLETARLTCHLREAASHVRVACITAHGFEQHVIDCP
jgi:hypothetical protein